MVRVHRHRHHHQHLQQQHHTAPRHALARFALQQPAAYAAASERAPAQQQKDLQASRESLVLLRNDRSLLPLRKGQRIAVLGPHAQAHKLLLQPYPAIVSHFRDRELWCPHSNPRLLGGLLRRGEPGALGLAAG